MERNETRRYIEADEALRRHLAKAFCVGPRTVYNALNYAGDSELCRRIRAHALQKGGRVMVVLPETSFEDLRRGETSPNGGDDREGIVEDERGL